MSPPTHDRHASGRTRDSGSAGRSRSPAATCSRSLTVDDTTTITTSQHPTDGNTDLSDHESTSNTGDKEQDPARKRRQRTKCHTKVIEEGNKSDKDLPPLELALRESPEILKCICSPNCDRPRLSQIPIASLRTLPPC